MRSRSSVAGQQSRVETNRRGETVRDAGQRLPGAQRLGAHEVETEVQVAEPEPVLAAPGGGGGERVPRLTGAAPAPLLVVQPGERAEERVEIRRHVEPEHLDVVADVSDDRQLAGRERRGKPAREPRAADAAREEPPSRREREQCPCSPPARPPRRSRSASLSTSSTSSGARRRQRMRGRGTAPRCPAPYSGAKTAGSGNESAFVVPSRAGTSASPAAARATTASARQIGVDDEDVVGSCASPVTTAAPSPPRVEHRCRAGRHDGRIVGDDDRPPDGEAGLDDVAEHRDRDAGTKGRRQTPLEVAAVGNRWSAREERTHENMRDVADPSNDELAEALERFRRPSPRRVERVRGTRLPAGRRPRSRSRARRAARARGPRGEIAGVGPGIEPRLQELVETGELAEARSCGSDWRPSVRKARRRPRAGRGLLLNRARALADRVARELDGSLRATRVAAPSSPHGSRWSCVTERPSTAWQSCPT